MPRSLRPLRWAVWIAACLVIPLRVAAQGDLELSQDQTRFNLQFTNNVLPAATRDPVVKPNQFRSVVTFGGGVVPRTLTHSSSNAANFGRRVQDLNLPSAGAGSSLQLVLTASRLGAPYRSRTATQLFGSVITPPDTDEFGVALSTRSPAVTAESYWAPEPFSTNSPAETGFYWSPHSRRVYAVTTGPISVPWRRAEQGTVATPTATLGNGVVAGITYPIYTRKYVVSGSPVVAPRRIYWTKGDYAKSGRAVSVPPSRVKLASVIYHRDFMERVSNAVAQISIITSPTNLLTEKRTLWFDSDTSQIDAYNLEGRVFVELLGSATGTASGSEVIPREALGFEIVDVFREPAPEDVTVDIGERIPAYADGRPDLDLTPEAVQDVARQFAYRKVRAGTDDWEFIATRETENANDLLMHWLEEGVAGIRWPLRYVRYRLVWPNEIARYSHYIRPLVASEEQAKTTAVPLPNQNAPFIQYQDPLDRPRAKLTDTFAYYTYLTPEHPTHRALLRFTSGDDVRFERVFSWLDGYLQDLDRGTLLPDPGALARGPALGLTEVADYVAGLKRYPAARAQYLMDRAAYQTGRARGVNGAWKLELGENKDAVVGLDSWSLEILVRDEAGAELPPRLFSGTLLGIPSGSTWLTSTSSVARVTNSVTAVRVILKGLQITGTADVQLWLTAPTGRRCALLTGAGRGAASTVSLLFDDAARSQVPNVIPATGTYRVSNRAGLVRAPDGSLTSTVTSLEALLNVAPVLPVEPKIPEWITEIGRPGVLHESALVGQRIEAPAHHGVASGAPSYTGYLNQAVGTFFNTSAYHDPFAEGWEIAARGAIIPVNASPVAHQLEVLWFRRNALSTTQAQQGFQSILWPEITARYTVEWPTSATRIVLASNQGSGGLPSAQSRGSIYSQNDASKPGFNPNEEHALMQGGQVYALRDDLNDLRDATFSSRPFVLLQYVDDDARPAMRAFEVVREDAANGFVFDYQVQAGTVLQPPMPLPLLEAPLARKIPGQPRVSLNQEYESWSVSNSKVAASALGVPLWTLSTTNPLFLAPFESAALQTTNRTAPFLPTAPEWLFITGRRARDLTGVLSSRAPFRVRSASRGASPLHQRFQVASVAGLSRGAVMVGALREAATPVLWRATVSDLNAAEAWVELSFATALPDRVEGTSWLVLADGTGADHRFDGWRLGLEPLPALSDPGQRQTYASFTHRDRKGNHWIYRGPHQEQGTAALTMQFYYRTQPGFFFPSRALGDQPPIGTITPYLRAVADEGGFVGEGVEGNADDDQRGDGSPLGIRYRAVWPSSTPVLQMAETLTTPKRGLPGVRGQTSLSVLYQQSHVTGGSQAPSVVLHDPTREKEFRLESPQSTTTLNRLPAAVATTTYRGRTYFPLLPPHLVERFWLDPHRGAHGALVLAGRFVEAGLGDSYLLPNVVSGPDREALLGLCASCDPADQAKWGAAVDGLSTELQTWVESQATPGTFEVDRQVHPPLVIGPGDVAEVRNSEVAVDSYALTAVGPGTGYISLIAGDGFAATPEGDPVSVHVLRVSPTLYRGEVVPVESSNPLNEKLTLQQVVDLAGRTTGYEFEWRYAAPMDGKPPRVYEPTSDHVLASGAWAHLPFLLPTDTARTVLDASPARLGSSVESRVVPVSAVPFTDLQLTGNIVSFLPGSNLPRLVPGLPLTLGTREGREMAGTVHALTTPTTNRVFVALDPDAAAVLFPSEITRVQERLNPDGPQSLLHRQFDLGPSDTYSEVWLSMDLESGVAAQVTIDGQVVARVNTSRDATPPGNPPAELAAAVLAQAFRLPAGALAEGTPLPGGARRHVIVVELFSQAVPEASLHFDLRLEGLRDVDVTDQHWLSLDPEQFADGTRAILGGSADVKSLSDNYVIMRYQAATNTHASWVPDPLDPRRNLGWSAWTEPQLAEGWIKRVLRGINPFNQRVTDLFNHQINTDASLVAQAGARWEGEVPLNLEALNQAGLIEIYETVLNRGKMLSLGGGINYGPANDALLLAAGYLNDLYMILGNEASADASNPTIGIGTRDQTYGDIATALFSFKGQLPTVLEEELALLRGRDDSMLPAITTRPVYNRLLWNYTRGIDSGEVIYALNYNVLDQNDDGKVDAEDARKLYPQGHGDAYGHYLTATKGYYRLLLDPSFDWVPRIEAVTILGKPVSVDYQDERKFAAAALSVARTGRQIAELTWRQQFNVNPAAGWVALSSAGATSASGTPKFWTFDDWSSRTGQGAYLHWLVGNAILPAHDTEPTHQGTLQQVDRTTVPELRELPSLGSSLQTTMDNAEGRLTPLGLPAHSIPFDLNPLSVANGNNTSHFEQIYQRARDALRNALTSFDDAKDVTRLMRSEEDSLAELRTDVRRQELAYQNTLIELYGTPYTDDIGPGRTYAAGYDGPDLAHFMYVDLKELAYPTLGLVPTRDSLWRVDVQTFNQDWLKSDEVYQEAGRSIAAETEDRISDFSFITLARSYPVDGQPLRGDYEAKPSFSIEYNLAGHGFAKPSTWVGRRASPGRLQQSISDILKARNAAFEAFRTAELAKDDLDWAIRALERRIESHSKIRDLQNTKVALDTVLSTAKSAAEIVDLAIDAVTAQVTDISAATAEAIPTTLVAGLAVGTDPGAPVRAFAKSAGVVIKTSRDWVKIARASLISGLELANQVQANVIDLAIEDENWKQELRDITTEIRSKVYGVENQMTSINAALQELDDAQRAYQAAAAEGDRLQAERQVFRQRSAAILQGFRTRDAAFRVFRNEKLERYKILFDLAAQYTYLAAQAFDYETGLLHTEKGRSFIQRIIQSRALGVMPDGEPQFAGSNTGDPGLSSIMAEMNADWSVLRTRLGFKNPDAYGTTASLRREHFRILPGVDHDAAWVDRLNAGRRDNLLDDPDVRRYCMQIDPRNGLPVPGLILEFSTTITDGLNLFGRPLAPGDHAFSTASFATKIFGIGVALEGYAGMEPPSAHDAAVEAAGGESPSDPDLGFLDPDAMAANPYLYLIPVGLDSMRSPPLGDTSTVRTWSVNDIAIPLPFNLGGSEHSTAKLWQSADSLSEPLFAFRKHQPFRPVPSSSYFEDLVVYWTGGELERTQYNNTRLLGRSAWNSRWKLVIPGRTLLADPQDGLDRFIRGVKDVRLYFMTYSYSGN
ncbi:MAG: hypothetical protein IT580_11005 [Verrucomicrobiales bacterium]|nr:hypothetical protein [Verrucomicrobiales bacterium]